MNQDNQNVWGIEWDNYDSQRSVELPAGRYTFEVESLNRGVSKSNQQYALAKCKVVEAEDEDHVGRVYVEYLSLETARIGFSKAFLEDIGAESCLSPKGSPQDAEGCVFEADIAIVKSNGKDYRNLRNIEPLEADSNSGESVSEPEPKPEPKPEKKTGRRRRSAR